MRPYKRLFEDTKYDVHNNVPIKSSIDFLYHGTNVPSALWVTKRNILKPGHGNNNKIISFSTNLKYYKSHHVPILGTIAILWKLNYKKLKDDKIKLVLNTKNIKKADNYEVIVRENKIEKFNKYVEETYIFKKETEEYYEFMKNKSLDIKKNPKDYTNDTSVKSYWISFGFKKEPKNFEEFFKIYINIIKKRFKDIKILERNIL